MSRMDESAFGLSAEELIQIASMDYNPKHRKTSKSKKLHSQRLPVPFTMQLSKEAQIAMQLAREDTKQMIEEQDFLEEFRRPNAQLPTLPEIPNGAAEDSVTSVAIRNRPETSVSSSASSSASTFTEIYRRRQSARMSRDITDESYAEENERKRALGGGKIESTMELVEVVRADEPQIDDARVIEELAMTNAVDKCMVWMEATGSMPEDEMRELN